MCENKEQLNRNGGGFDNVDGPGPHPFDGLEGLRFEVHLQYGPIRGDHYAKVAARLENEIRTAMAQVLGSGQLSFEVGGHVVEPQMAIVPIPPHDG